MVCRSPTVVILLTLVDDYVTNSFMCRNTKDSNPGMFGSGHCYIALWCQEYGILSMVSVILAMVSSVWDFGMVSGVWDIGHGVKIMGY